MKTSSACILDRIEPNAAKAILKEELNVGKREVREEDGVSVEDDVRRKRTDHMLLMWPVLVRQLLGAACIVAQFVGKVLP